MDETKNKNPNQAETVPVIADLQETKEGDKHLPNTIDLPADKAYYLQRTQVLSELQSEILGWAKGRFWAITVIVLIIGVLGGGSLMTALIETRVNSQIVREIERYQSKLDELRETTAVAKRTTQDANKIAGTVQAKLSKFDKRAGDLEASANSLAGDLSKITASGFEVSDKLRIELQKLSQVVKTIVQKQAQLDARASDLVTEVDQIQTSLLGSETRISQEKGRADLAKYSIKLYEMTGYEQIERVLRKQGFSVTVRPTSDTLENRSGIGISKDLPVALAIDVITTVRAVWPEMVYVYPSDINEGKTTLVGGLEGVLAGMGYRKLTADEFKKLENKRQTKSEFAALLDSHRVK